MSQDPVLSCIQPTGDLHIGNFFGAIANWVRLQKEYSCIYGIVDLHAMTMPYDPRQLREHTRQMVIDLMACGIDPDKAILFVQSLVPEHTELCWILSCFCSYGDLTRQTQFKDKAQQLEQNGPGDYFLSAGLFSYPVLQAADILVYRAQYIPVGRDQEQHLELTRDISRRFNQRFGEYFPVPEALFTDTPRIQSLADPSKKMSKSLGPKHYIGIFESPDIILDKVRVAVTDSGAGSPDRHMSPGVENLLRLLSAAGQPQMADEYRSRYLTGERSYLAMKNSVADALIDLTSPLRQRRNELLHDSAPLETAIHANSARAREIARETLRGVRMLVGLPER